jgi:cold shock CspA family protein
MGRSQDTFSKKEKEKNRLKKRKEKEEKKEERKANSNKGKSFEEMLAYVDENGNISATPLDPKKKKEIKQEDITIGVMKHVEEPEEIERSGKVTYFNETKGYGFIKDQKSQEAIFVHINALSGPLKEGDLVTFEIEKGPKGPSAVSVKITG